MHCKSGYSTEYGRKWRTKNPSKLKASQLKRHYGMTLPQYLKLLEDQEDGCAICGRPAKEGVDLCVDHCHSSGKIRGLLCSDCNLAIGKMGDSPERLREAADYLEGKGTVS